MAWTFASRYPKRITSAQSNVSRAFLLRDSPFSVGVPKHLRTRANDNAAQEEQVAAAGTPIIRVHVRMCLFSVGCSVCVSMRKSHEIFKLRDMSFIEHCPCVFWHRRQLQHHGKTLCCEATGSGQKRNSSDSICQRWRVQEELDTMISFPYLRHSSLVSPPTLISL
jgi:hypothetical protein